MYDRGRAHVKPLRQPICQSYECKACWPQPQEANSRLCLKVTLIQTAFYDVSIQNRKFVLIR
jgi:hypothetical protein